MFECAHKSMRASVSVSVSANVYAFDAPESSSSKMHKWFALFILIL